MVNAHHTASPSVLMLPPGALRSTDSTASEPKTSSPTTDPATYVVSRTCELSRARWPTRTRVETSRSSRSGLSSGSSTASRSSTCVRKNSQRSSESHSRAE